MKATTDCKECEQQDQEQKQAHLNNLEVVGTSAVPSLRFLHKLTREVQSHSAGGEGKALLQHGMDYWPPVGYSLHLGVVLDA